MKEERGVNSERIGKVKEEKMMEQIRIRGKKRKKIKRKRRQPVGKQIRQEGIG